jgi:hypothetical protein
MKINFAAILLGVTVAAHGQTMDWEKQTYRTVLSLKALPGQAPALAAFYKTGPGSKTIPARLKASPNMLAWTLLRNVYPGDTNVEVDHLIGVTMKGAPSEPNQEMNAKIVREAAGISYEDYMQKARAMTAQVGQTLNHVHHSVVGAPLAEGDYVVVRRLKSQENQRQNMLDLARDMMLPLAEDRVKAGGSFKSWSFSYVAFPTGDATPYDAAEVRVFKDLASAVAASGGTGTGAAERFAKKFPDKSYTAFVDALRASSKVVRTDLYRVVATFSK